MSADFDQHYKSAFIDPLWFDVTRSGETRGPRERSAPRATVYKKYVAGLRRQVPLHICESWALGACVRLAGLTDDQQIRDQLLNMAREWMGAAMHEGEPTAPAPVHLMKTAA